MEKVLVKWSTGWGDEMDIDGFVIMSSENWKNFKNRVKKIRNEFSIWVGSNQDIEYSDGDDLLSQLTVKKLSQEEIKLLAKFFGNSFGHTEFLNAESEEKWEEEEDIEEIEDNDESEY